MKGNSHALLSRWLLLGLALAFAVPQVKADIGISIVNSASTNVGVAFKIGITPSVALANGPNYANWGPGATMWSLGVNNSFAGSNYVLLHIKA